MFLVMQKAKKSIDSLPGRGSSQCPFSTENYSVLPAINTVKTNLERGERCLVEARAKEKAQFTGVNEHFDAALNEEQTSATRY